MCISRVAGIVLLVRTKIGVVYGAGGLEGGRRWLESEGRGWPFGRYREKECRGRVGRGSRLQWSSVRLE